MSKPTVKVEKMEVRHEDYPSLHIYLVLIEDESGVWQETFGTKELLQAFLRGFRAGSYVVAGIHMEEVEIP